MEETEEEMLTCEICGETKIVEDFCFRHYALADRVIICKDCCEFCQEEWHEWNEADNFYDRRDL